MPALHSSLSLFTVSLACALLVVSPARGEQTLEENFKLGTDSRVAGESLDGATIPNSEATWSCKSNTVQFAGTADDGYGVFTTDGSCVVKTELPPTGDVIEVKADVHPVGQSWIAIGMGNPRNDFDNGWSDGVIFLLNGAGGYQIFAMGTTITLGEGSQVPNYEADAMNTIKFIYRKKENTLECFINDRRVSKEIDLGAQSVTPDLSFVGFSSFGQAANIKSVKNFSLTIN